MVYQWSTRFSCGLNLGVRRQGWKTLQLPYDMGVGGESHLRRVTELLG
jgi:hypothetical protein